jgi:hypothetical protein
LIRHIFEKAHSCIAWSEYLINRFGFQWRSLLSVESPRKLVGMKKLLPGSLTLNSATKIGTLQVVGTANLWHVCVPVASPAVRRLRVAMPRYREVVDVSGGVGTGYQPGYVPIPSMLCGAADFCLPWITTQPSIMGRKHELSELRTAHLARVACATSRKRERLDWLPPRDEVCLPLFPRLHIARHLLLLLRDLDVDAATR